jgi:hypothetical protein
VFEEYRQVWYVLTLCLFFARKDADCWSTPPYTASDHAEIIRQPEITMAVSEILAELSFSASYTAIRAASTNEQKYALHFLHRISGSGMFFLRFALNTENLI